MKTKSALAILSIGILVSCTSQPPSAQNAAKPESTQVTSACAHDWTKLLDTWNRYLVSSTPELAGSLIEQLKSATPSRETQEKCSEQQFKAEQTFYKEQSQVHSATPNRGNRGAEVLDALLKYTEGSHSDDDGIETKYWIGKSITLDPEAFLELISKNYAGKDCPFAASEPFYEGEDEGASPEERLKLYDQAIQEFQARLKVLEAVKNIKYAKTKTECIQSLKTAVRERTEGSADLKKKLKEKSK